MLLTEWNLDEAIEVAREEGWEDGREEGREEGILITARNALAQGASVDFIRKITDLTPDAIEKLRR
jgi:predicted transposase/invertase (TIGR01784 family)